MTEPACGATENSTHYLDSVDDGISWLHPSPRERYMLKLRVHPISATWPSEGTKERTQLDREICKYLIMVRSLPAVNEDAELLKANALGSVLSKLLKQPEIPTTQKYRLTTEDYLRVRNDGNQHLDTEEMVIAIKEHGFEGVDYVDVMMVECRLHEAEKQLKKQSKKKRSFNIGVYLRAREEEGNQHLTASEMLGVIKARGYEDAEMPEVLKYYRMFN